jgi:DNA primase
MEGRVGDFIIPSSETIHNQTKTLAAYARGRSKNHGCSLGEDRVAEVQRVKAANDIVDVIGSYIALRPAGPTFKGLCPFHDDHRPSFTVDPRWQNYRCWACQKSGDVFSFVQDHDKVSFPEALELLARRAGITLEKTADSQQNRSRAFMLEVMRWAAEQFQRCLLDASQAEAARIYLGERKLSGETVRRFTLGFAPPDGDWLVALARQANLSLELLEQVGLIAKRTECNGYFDRFRERVMFPIRDGRGQVVAFGGRILPSSPLAAKAPKYYNSADTPLFSKSENLYGIDQARQAGQAAGYLAVVEGYTDVLMAQQMGVPQVVATMGTALNARHIRQLRRFVPRVVLVFDNDAGGVTGVDRALELFVSHDLELCVATLPEGLDPCDLLVQQGPEPLRTALTNAVDVLEFKLNRVLSTAADEGVEGRRRAIDGVLRVIALAPELPDQAGAVKRELVVTRVSQRLGVKGENLWARVQEMRASKRPVSEREPANKISERQIATEEPQKAPPLELDLLRVLLADPLLVPVAQAEIAPASIEHPRLRLLLEVLYRLHAEGVIPDLDHARLRIDNPALMAMALKLQEVGRAHTDRATWLRQILARFRERQQLPAKQELQNQLHAASDHATAVELLRQLQKKSC